MWWCKLELQIDKFMAVATTVATAITVQLFGSRGVTILPTDSQNVLVNPLISYNGAVTMDTVISN